jgi:drug/metabolite transporter (DMT)-like permease
MPDRRWIVFFCFAVLYLVWGSTFLAIRLAVETMPPLLVGGFRHFLAGIILLAVIAAFGYRIKPEGMLNAFLVGTLTAGIANGSLIIAEKTVPSGIAAISFTTMPIFVLLFNWAAFEKIRPTLFDWIAIPIGFFGTSLVVGSGKSLSGDELSTYEIGLLVACPLFWSMGSLLSRKLVLPRSILASSAYQMIGGGALLLVLALFNHDVSEMFRHPPTSQSLWSVVYLTLMGSLLGYSAFAYLMKNVDPRLAATYAFVNPVVALFLGIWWGEKILSPEMLFGSALAILSVTTVILSRWLERPKLV